MSKKKKLTPNQDKYKELQKRLKRKLRDVKKRGFTPNSAFDENILNELPKRVTEASLKKLQEIRENIYDYLRYYSPLREVYISGTERKKQEQVESARKAAETRRENARRTDKFWEDYEDQFGYDYSKGYLESLPEESLQAIQQIEEILDEWSPNSNWNSELQALKQEDKDTIKNVFDGARQSLGDDVVARNIINNQTELLSILNNALYDSGNKYKVFSGSGREGMRKAIERITAILYGRPLTVQESINITSISENLNESE